MSLEVDKELGNQQTPQKYEAQDHGEKVTMSHLCTLH